MSNEEKSSSLLAITISILGILTIALFFGLLLMQKKENNNLDITEALSLVQPPPVTETFDPVSWAREGVEYPPLQKEEKPLPENPTKSVEELNSMTAAENDSPTQTTVTTVKPITNNEEKPVVRKVTNSPVASTSGNTYRKVNENGYWIQVFVTIDQLKAEEIRDDLVARGIPAVIQIFGGSSRKYRIRIGAFNDKMEAEKLASTVRQIRGFEGSFVIISPVTRQIPFG